MPETLSITLNVTLARDAYQLWLAAGNVGSLNDFFAAIGGGTIVAPVFTLSPSVSGATTPGAPLTRTLGTAVGVAVELSGQWFKNSAPTGDDAATYSSSVAGDVIFWRSTAFNAGGTTTADSNHVSVASAAIAPSFTVAPAVSGATTPGATLTRSLGTASGSPSPTLSGQWVKNGTATGVTTATYNATDAGDVVLWRGVATNSAGSDTEDSNSITVSASLSAPAYTANPTISGGTGLSATLTRTPGAATGNPTPTLAGAWWRKPAGGSYATTGVTTATYTAARADGDTMQWRETATNGVGSPATAVSNEIVAAGATTPPAYVSNPTISGGTGLAVTLTRVSGVVTGNPTPTLSGEWWKRPAGGSYAATGVTTATYTAARTDGDTMQWRETATNGVGSPATAVSNEIVANPPLTIITGSHLQSLDADHSQYYDPVTDIPAWSLGHVIELVSGTNGSPSGAIVTQLRTDYTGIPYSLIKGPAFHAGGPLADGVWKLYVGIRDGDGTYGTNLRGLFSRYVYDPSSSIAPGLIGATLTIDPSPGFAGGDYFIENQTGFYFNTQSVQLQSITGPTIPNGEFFGSWRISAVATPLDLVPASSFAGAVKLLIFGDSITEAMTDFFPATVNRVFASASSRTLLNRGVGGTKSDQWLPGQTHYTNLVSAANTAGITVMQYSIGTNGNSASDNIAHIQATVTGLFADVPTLQYFVLQDVISPQGDTRITDINAGLAGVAGAVLGTMDRHAMFAANPGFLADGIHPSQIGRKYDAEELMRGLKSYIEAVA